MRVLVTGAGGFVGGAVVRSLAGCVGAEVWGVARRPPEACGAIRTAVADVADESSVEALGRLGPFDAVVHSAGLAHRFGATDEAEFQKVNVDGTANVARFAAGQGARFVLMSSVSVYGDHGAAAVDEDAECRPFGAYARSKLESEEVARTHLPASDLLILRLATVVGPGDPGNTARLITQISRRRFFQVGDGSNKKTFVAIGDLAANATALTLSRNASGTYNVAGEPVTVRAVVDAIREALGRKPGRLWLPAEPFRALAGVGRFIPVGGVLFRANDLLRKWLSDDVYSGARFRSLPGVEPAEPVLQAIADETRWVALKR